ncbi:hypothetical protein HY406_01625 [Candidatus Giovannonibacteria bacterium]|nr:hypothetical protein [Candidatus Giovannonibacteria bacterium]
MIATIGEEAAKTLIGRVQTQKRPTTYCVLKYRGAIAQKWEWASCGDEFEYLEILRDPGVNEVEILWKSKEFEAACRERTKKEMFMRNALERSEAGEMLTEEEQGAIEEDAFVCW